MLELKVWMCVLQPLPAFRQPSHCGASAHQRLKAMQEHGITPSILKSENFADGPEYNRRMKERYAETGY